VDHFCNNKGKNVRIN